MRDTPQSSVLSIIKASPLLRHLSPAVQEQMAAQTQLQLLPRGHVLFLNGDAAQRCFIILNGWVKLFRETLDGAQAVVDILPQGHLFGEAAIFEQDTYPFSAEAAEPCEIATLPLAPLKADIQENPKLALSMLSSMAHYRRQQDQELEHRTLQTAPQRIGCFLLRLTDQQASGPATIHLPYDKMLLAARLGMQPETFSRALNRLRDETGIRIKGATVELDSVQQLARYSCSACSSEFPCSDVARTN